MFLVKTQFANSIWIVKKALFIDSTFHTDIEIWKQNVFSLSCVIIILYNLNKI